MWIRRPSDLALLALLACGALGGRDARAAPPTSSPNAAQEDPLAAYRGRFKLGMDRYKAGALAEAIGYWEPIYRELGEQKGYRLAYNLGVAYEELGDATRAAERFQSFLAEVDARRGRAEVLSSIVQKEETDARSRVAGLMATKGRIQIAPGNPPRAAQVDANEPRLAGFVAWVTPGEHVVTFGPGTPEAESKTVEARAGEMLEVAPTPPPPPVPPPSATASAGPAPSATASVFPPPPGAGYVRDETLHPFSPVLILVGGGLAVGAGIAAVALESHANTLHDRFVAEQGTTGVISTDDRQSFDAARTSGYTAVGGAIGLGVATAGLAAWYFLGASRHEVFVSPTVAPERGGASLAVHARF